MKKIIVYFLFLFFCLSTCCQNSKIEFVKYSGFDYYSIYDSVYENIDSIRFIMSSPVTPYNPTIIFLQGSGNYPLIGYFANLDTIISFALIPPFNIEEYKNSYNFLCIAKPGTPVCVEWSNDKQLPLIDTTYLGYNIFNKMDFLDYYVSQTKQVVGHLKNNILDGDAEIYLMGNSQGGRVATKYVYENPKEIDRLILYSSGIVDRHHEEILQWRQLADCGNISDDEAQKNIDEIYKRYADLRDYVDYFRDNPEANIENVEQHNHFMNDYTYNFDIPINYLTKIDIPILNVYGMRDLKARDNDMLPLIFTRLNKDNITIMPLPDCNHLFVRETINDEGKIEQEYIGDSVLVKILQWLQE